MTDTEAMQAIHALMDGREWSADTLGEIACILEKAGYPVRDSNMADLSDYLDNH